MADLRTIGRVTHDLEPKRSHQGALYLRFTLENKSFTLPWKEEYEDGGWPEIDYQLHILDNGGNESTYSLNL